MVPPAAPGYPRPACGRPAGIRCTRARRGFQGLAVWGTATAWDRGPVGGAADRVRVSSWSRTPASCWSGATSRRFGWRAPRAGVAALDRHPRGTRWGFRAGAPRSTRWGRGAGWPASTAGPGRWGTSAAGAGGHRAAGPARTWALVRRRRGPTARPRAWVTTLTSHQGLALTRRAASAPPGAPRARPGRGRIARTWRGFEGCVGTRSTNGTPGTRRRRGSKPLGVRRRGAELGVGTCPGQAMVSAGRAGCCSAESFAGIAARRVGTRSSRTTGAGLGSRRAIHPGGWASAARSIGLGVATFDRPAVGRPGSSATWPGDGDPRGTFRAVQPARAGLPVGDANSRRGTASALAVRGSRPRRRCRALGCTDVPGPGQRDIGPGVSAFQGDRLGPGRW